MNAAGTDYWTRIAREELQEDDRPLDQEVLREIRAWRQEDVSDPVRPNELVDRMIDDPRFADKVWRLGRRIDPNEALGLANHLANRLIDRKTDPGSRGVGYSGFPGLREVCRLSVRKLPVGADAQLSEILEVTLQANLRLSAEIFHWWCVQYKEDTQHFIDQKKVARTYHDALKKEFDDSAVKFLKALQATYDPYTLNHIIFLFDEKATNCKDSLPSSWTWMGPILITTGKSSPSCIVPQVVILLSAKRMTADAECPNFEFLENRASTLFGERLNEMLQILGEELDCADVDDELRERIEFVRRRAKEILGMRRQEEHKRKYPDAPNVVPPPESEDSAL